MTIRQYRKKARCRGGHPAHPGQRDRKLKRSSTAKPGEAKLPGPGRGITEGVSVHTLEGDMLAAWGDWIIRGVAGEHYPCKDSIFRDTYELVGGSL